VNGPCLFKRLAKLGQDSDMDVISQVKSMHPSSSPLSVPPGFRFHPTDEELLYYYLRKKVSYEPIDLDVIREIDLNKLEPWDLKGNWLPFTHTACNYKTLYSY
jgi:hypothetical protein